MARIEMNPELAQRLHSFITFGTWWTVVKNARSFHGGDNSRLAGIVLGGIPGADIAAEDVKFVNSINWDVDQSSILVTSVVTYGPTGNWWYVTGSTFVYGTVRVLGAQNDAVVRARATAYVNALMLPQKIVNPTIDRVEALPGGAGHDVSGHAELV
jgi:hypothetical protein